MDGKEKETDSEEGGSKRKVHDGKEELERRRHALS